MNSFIIFSTLRFLPDIDQYLLIVANRATYIGFRKHLPQYQYVIQWAKPFITIQNIEFVLLTNITMTKPFEMRPHLALSYHSSSIQLKVSFTFVDYYCLLVSDWDVGSDYETFLFSTTSPTKPSARVNDLTEIFSYHVQQLHTDKNMPWPKKDKRQKIQ